MNEDNLIAAASIPFIILVVIVVTLFKIFGG